LTAPKLQQTKNHEVEMSLRGVLRGFGLKVGPTFAARIRELVADHPTLSTVAEALLAARSTSQWLYAGIRDAGLAVELLETRHVRGAFKAMPVKTDRKDARGIAQLMRLGWFRPVHCKSLPAQEVRPTDLEDLKRAGSSMAET
jgi:hypothetical protein